MFNIAPACSFFSELINPKLGVCNFLVSKLVVLTSSLPNAVEKMYGYHYFLLYLIACDLEILEPLDGRKQ